MFVAKQLWGTIESVATVGYPYSSKIYLCSAEEMNKGLEQLVDELMMINFLLIYSFNCFSK